MDFLCKALTLTLAVFIKAESCEVGVSPPWERNTYIPQNSILRINCSADSSAHNPVWSILLSGTTAISQFSFPQTVALLNSRGFYEILVPEVPGTLKTIQLLVNSTQGNNGTLIKCNDVVSSTLFSETNLIIIEPSPIIMDTTDLHLQTINISWSSLYQSIYTMIINSNTDQPQILNLNQTYYVFTALEGAPPCKIYNFSITATYVGATYTGAGCSVPSPVISTMLPSLPNISQLESSLNFVLSKKFGGLSLHISFEPASYCEKYPIMNYTLVVNSSLNDEVVRSMSAVHADNFMLNEILSENADYSFKISVANTVGIVSTVNRHFYTTDVQRVVATLSNGTNASTLQCQFIMGSDATGCMVVLTSGNSQKAQYNLTRNQSKISEILSISLEHPPSCYTGVEAFDIESDGSVGTLPIPGQLMTISHTQCTPPLLVVPGSSGSNLTIFIGVIAALIVVALVLIIFPLGIIIALLLIKHNAKLSSFGVVFSQSESSIPEQMDSGSHKKLEQSLQIGDNSIQSQPITPSDTMRGRETTYCDITDNGVSEETAAIVKGETIYSEIPPTAGQSGGGGGAAAMDSDFRSARESGRGGQAEEEGRGGLDETATAAAGMPPEEALYEQPYAALERIPGDGADYSHTCHHPLSPLASDFSECEGAQYSSLDLNKDHIYFTLEPERPPHGVTSPDTSSYPVQTRNTSDAEDSASQPSTLGLTTSPPPIYQEIPDLSTRRGRKAATRSVTHRGICVSNTTHVPSRFPHIQRSRSVSTADGRSAQAPNQWALNRNIKIGTMV